nr:DUF2059 domain-containing protein [Fodinibius salsisoli]
MLATYKEELQNFYKKYLSWKKIGDDIKKVYFDNYTQKELNMLVGFYRTDSGQNIAKKMPEIFRQSAEVGRKEAMKHQGELQQMIMKKTQSQ